MTIPLTGATVLGRGHDNDVDVDEETVSRRHAVIVPAPDGFVLRDLASANGTFLNRDRLGGDEHLLKHGDRFRLAKSEATFVFRQKGADTVQVEVPARHEELPGIRDLGAKESELLEVLRSRKATAVGREEIARRVWPELSADAVLANQEIDRTVARLRQHIEDDPRRPVRLVTAGEYGYLLL